MLMSTIECGNPLRSNTECCFTDLVFWVELTWILECSKGLVSTCWKFHGFLNFFGVDRKSLSKRWHRSFKVSSLFSNCCCQAVIDGVAVQWSELKIPWAIASCVKNRCIEWVLKWLACRTAQQEKCWISHWPSAAPTFHRVQPLKLSLHVSTSKLIVDKTRHHLGEGGHNRLRYMVQQLDSCLRLGLANLVRLCQISSTCPNLTQEAQMK